MINKYHIFLAWFTNNLSEFNIFISFIYFKKFYVKISNKIIRENYN